jgi:DNA-binding winged helix-turn-helix (wHTH) protein
VAFDPERAKARCNRAGSIYVHTWQKALEILIVLVEHAGELVGKRQLMARVWPNTTVEEGNLKVHVAALRRVLAERQNGRRYIQTIAGAWLRVRSSDRIARGCWRLTNLIAEAEAQSAEYDDGCDEGGSSRFAPSERAVGFDRRRIW